MGVKDLWSILEPAKIEVSLEELSGSTLAIDLGFWTCQLNSVVEADASVHKLYLRNLLFRILGLLKRDITPVFVSEGKPPELKLETISRRLQQRKGREQVTYRSHSLKRSRFEGLLKECKELIRLAGLVCLDSDGEGEALCAALNAQNVVDGVLTDDNDAFLYGAKVVYKSFNLFGDNPVLEKYQTCDIEQKLNLDRDRMIALALLLGCDLCPGGVLGLGKERAIKILQNVSNFETSILTRMKKWECESSEECDEYSRRKICNTPNFPNNLVIEEYKRLRFAEKLSKQSLRTRPDFEGLVIFLSEKLLWKREYAVHALVPVYTCQALRPNKSDGSWNSNLEIDSLVKRRVKKGVRCVEVRWKRLEEDRWSSDDFYTSVETEESLSYAFPYLMNQFVHSESEHVTVISKRKGKAKTVNEHHQTLVEVENQLAHLVLSPTPDEQSNIAPSAANAHGFLENISPRPFLERVRRLMDDRSVHTEIHLTNF